MYKVFLDSNFNPVPKEQATLVKRVGDDGAVTFYRPSRANGAAPRQKDNQQKAHLPDTESQTWLDLGAQLGIDFAKVAPAQWLEGCRVEMEHAATVGGDKETIAKIARDHFSEDADYYVKLKRVEQGQKAAMPQWGLTEIKARGNPNHDPLTGEFTGAGNSNKPKQETPLHEQIAASEGVSHNFHKGGTPDNPFYRLEVIPNHTADKQGKPKPKEGKFYLGNMQGGAIFTYQSHPMERLEDAVKQFIKAGYKYAGATKLNSQKDDVAMKAAMSQRGLSGGQAHSPHFVIADKS